MVEDCLGSICAACGRFSEGSGEVAWRTRSQVARDAPAAVEARAARILAVFVQPSGADWDLRCSISVRRWLISGLIPLRTAIILSTSWTIGGFCPFWGGESLKRAESEFVKAFLWTSNSAEMPSRVAGGYFSLGEVRVPVMARWKFWRAAIISAGLKVVSRPEMREDSLTISLCT